MRSASPAFRLLRMARHLRGTPFDFFGWSAERRAERHFLSEYLSWVAVAMAHLTPVTAGRVRAVVNAANDVHGYSHVRQASIATVRAAVAEQLGELSGDVMPRSDRFPLAG